MIRLWIPTFYDENKAMLSNTRAVDDGENYELIGCSSGKITTRLIKGLKEHCVRSPYLHITKINYNNYCGIREIIEDSWFTPRGLYCPDPDSLVPEVIENQEAYKYVRAEIINLKVIIENAIARGIPVTYLQDGQVIEHGDIKIICYRQQTNILKADDNMGVSYFDNNTFYYWLPELRYFSTGEANNDIYKMCVDNNINPIFLRLPNHGKSITWEQAQQLRKLGVACCWDNTDDDTDGKRNCIQSGILYLDCHTDTNVLFMNGKAILTADNCDYIYDVPYNKPNSEEGWINDFRGWWYCYKDGSWAIGWKKLEYRGEDVWFYFDERGYSVTGWQYINEVSSNKKNWFYFDPVNGTAKIGWFNEDGLWYYFDEYTGMHSGWLEYGGKMCYFETRSDTGKSSAYYNRIAVIDGEIWGFDKFCYRTEKYTDNYEGG